MNAVMRIGIAGAGLIGRKHIELIEASRDCVLAGIADPSLDAKAFAEARSIPWYPDYRALLDGARPDGLIVASPNEMHLSMTLDCVERGVPALVEKPVTVSVSDATPAPWSWELSSGENAAYPRQNQPCYLFARTKGSLAVPTMQLWSYPGQDGRYAPLTYAELKAASFDPLVEQLRHFLAVIARREKPLISVEDAAGTLAVVEAVSEAARTGAGISPSKITEYIA